jgi:hypothetical protein
LLGSVQGVNVGTSVHLFSVIGYEKALIADQLLLVNYDDVSVAKVITVVARYAPVLHCHAKVCRGRC